jgi:hypothetical protein
MSALSRAILVLVVLAGSAGAQPSPEATKLFEEGRDLAKQHDWAGACDRFQKSLALDPAPGTKLNLGDCLEKQGKVRAGWMMFEDAARDFDRNGDPRAKFAHERATAASAKLGTVLIRLPESSLPGLTVRVGDRDTTPQPEIEERVDPGKLFVSVAAPDKQVFVGEVLAVAGKTAIVNVPELKDAIKDPGPAPMTPERPAGARRTRVRIAIALGVGGALALAGSGVLALSAKSQYDDAFESGECIATEAGNFCSDAGLDEIDRAGSKADIATGFAIAGVALAAVAVIVYVTAPKEGVTVAPTATSSSAGLVLGGTF